MISKISLVAAVLLALAGSGPALAKNHNPSTHNHATATIDVHCGNPAYAKRHPDKCPG